jgi:hypothetical protein
MTKSASILSAGRMRRLVVLKPLAILLAMLMLPPELPFFGRFSLMQTAKAISVCGNQASIFQVCATASNNFETEALSDYEQQYNLKPGDGNLIYSLGRTDLRMSFRGFLFDKLIGAIKASPANRTGAEQAMISYFQGVMQQHEIAQYMVATADRDLFQQHLCQWVPDVDLETAYGQSINLAPYCNFGGGNPLTGLLNGPPDLPTIDYFIAKGYKAAYENPLEAAASKSSTVISNGAGAGLVLSQTGVAEIAALGSVVANAAGIMTASKTIPSLSKGFWPHSANRLNLKIKRFNILGKDSSFIKVTSRPLSACLKLVRIIGGVSVLLEIATTVVSVVFAIMDAQEQQNEIDALNAALDKAKNNLPDLGSFVDDTNGPGYDKLEDVFLELTLSEYDSNAPLPLPGTNDPKFVTNSSSVTNQAGPITFQDQDGETWTAEPYSQNWIVMNGTDANHSPIVRFGNYMTYLGKDSSNNTVAYKAWINNGNFMVAKTLPAADDLICQAGPNGLYQGDTTKCAGFTPDHLTMLDANGNAITVTMSQGVTYDSPTPANAAFTAGVGGSVTIKAHGIPAPDFNVVDITPPGLTFSNLTHGPGVTSVQLNISSAMSPQSFTFNLLFANGASSISVPFTVNIDTVVHITSPTTFNMTYGVPVNFVVTATGSPVHFDFSKGPQIPDGITITDHGDGTAGITGTPMPGALFDGQCLAAPCVVRAFNEISSDSSPLVLNVFTPPQPSFTSPSQVTFRAGEYNEFVVKINGGLTPGGVNVYQAVDACPLSKPSWLVESQRPNGDLMLSGTPPFLLNNQTLDMRFVAPLGGASRGLRLPVPFVQAQSHIGQLPELSFDAVSHCAAGYAGSREHLPDGKWFEPDLLPRQPTRRREFQFGIRCIQF